MYLWYRILSPTFLTLCSCNRFNIYASLRRASSTRTKSKTWLNTSQPEAMEPKVRLAQITCRASLRPEVGEVAFPLFSPHHHDHDGLRQYRHCAYLGERHHGT